MDEVKIVARVTTVVQGCLSNRSKRSRNDGVGKAIVHSVYAFEVLLMMLLPQNEYAWMQHGPFHQREVDHCLGQCLSLHHRLGGV